MIDPITMSQLAQMRHQEFIDDAARYRRFAHVPRQSLSTVVRRFAAPMVSAVRPSAEQEQMRAAASVLTADPCP